ncbi:MAG: AAA family ATPase [Candidatus Bipolaricaulia bacterium]
MVFKIAVAGKGGTGKTTISGLIVQLLLRRGEGPILAVDADPNANLGDLLGLEAETTVGGLQAEIRDKRHDLPPGVPLSRHVEYELHQALVEGEGVDLLVMGRGEGPGCYCAVNDILRSYLNSIQGGYRWVVLDNEAGMEHLSRRITQDVDLLLIVSDANPIAIRAAVRIEKLADELGLRTGEGYLILNNLRSELPEPAREEIARSGLQVLGEVPQDEAILKLCLEGRPLSELPPDSPALEAMEAMLKRALRKEARV